ncbi:geranylgeranyltransferase type II [Phlyctochytrium arcticum]|nr:geranylgeranyltransferase type II [Phlyctochytrium arcticum]
MQHHQKKTAVAGPSREESAAETKKVQKYREIFAELSQKRKDGVQTLETVSLTSQLLRLNPECYTAWNIRREALLALFPSMTDDKKMEICKEELSFTELLLRGNPKSYWVWNHRRWVLNTMPEPTWNIEYAMTNKFLDKDARNFHGWDYRRVVAQSWDKCTPSSELDFTTQKIKQNFSNYSAWHYRNKLLEQMYQGEELRKAIDADLILVKNAIFTEPEDQSAWLYYRWLLMSIADDRDQWLKEQKSISELLELEENSKWAMLTLVYINNKLAINADQNKDLLTRLADVDGLRREFYVYTSSKLTSAH